MQFFQWQWLKFLRLLGSKPAGEDMSRALDAMTEIGTDQGGRVTSSTVAPEVSTVAASDAGVVEAEADSLAAGVPDLSLDHGGGMGEGGLLGLSRRVAEACDIKRLLERNTEEVDNLLAALEGSYVKPGVGGKGTHMTHITFNFGMKTRLVFSSFFFS